MKGDYGSYRKLSRKFYWSDYNDLYVVTRFSLMGLINLYPGRASIDFYIAIIVCNSS